MVPAQTPSPKAAKWIAALERATTEQIVVYRVSPTMLGVAAIVDGQWTRKPYTITITGAGACEATCDCPGARKGHTCKHLAAAVFARKHGVYACKPRVAVDPLAECFA